MLGTLRGPRGWGLERSARTSGAGMREHTLRRFYTWGLHTCARMHLHVHPSMYTYRSHSCRICTHILHTFLHTKLLHAKVLVRACQRPGWLHAPLWACLPAHTGGRPCLCMLMPRLLCTPINGLVPVDTHTHTHTHTHTQKLRTTPPINVLAPK